MTITDIAPTGGGTASDADKRRAAGMAEEGADSYARAFTAVQNTRLVASLHGSGYWTNRRGGEGGNGGGRPAGGDGSGGGVRLVRTGGDGSNGG